MALAAESWQRGEIPGPIKAFAIKEPRTIATILKRAKRPLLVAGHKILEYRDKGIDLVEYLGELSRLIGGRIVATSHVVTEFRARGYEAYFIPPMELLDRLMDPEWKGLDGEGNYDLVVFIGMYYYMEWLILSGLKHFAYKHLKTVTLDPYYQPHANWSLPNMPVEKWIKYLDELKHRLGEG